LGQGELVNRWDLYHKMATAFDESPGVGDLVDNHSEFRGLEVEPTTPRRCHDIFNTTVSRGYQHRWPVIDKPIGFGKVN
jgi:hypothetical protein